MANHDARIEAVIGASGSGKSVYVKYTALRRRPPRLMVWDFKREYGEFGQVTESLEEVYDLTRKGRFAVVFQPTMDAKRRALQFDIFCRLAIGIGGVTLVVEELAFVTTPSWAPDAWKMMTCTGRHGGAHIIGTSQRPAQVDKDFLGNATLIRCGRLGHKADVRTMADLLFVEQHELMALDSLEYIARAAGEKICTRGKVRIPGIRTG